MSIKKKILFSTGFVIIVIYILSGIFAYYYFSNIFKARAISDDKIKLHQTEEQARFIYEDIEKFSKSIIIDSEIQEFLKAGHANTMSTRYNISGRLRSFIALREYVQSAIIISKDETTTLYTPIPSNEDYINEKLKEDWYQKYNKEDRYYFSNPHYIGIPGNTSDVISYIVDIRDMNSPATSIGKLVLNINLSYFEKFVVAGINEFDDFLWISDDNAIIFKKNLDKNFINLPEILSNMLDEQESKVIAIEQKLGYIIIDETPENGWKFISYTTKAQLFKPVNKVFYFFVFSTLLSILLIAIVILPIISRITKPITKLTKAMKGVSKGNLDIRVEKIDSHDEIEELGIGFNKMIDSLNKYISKSIEDERIRRQMEFDLLISQINPHFIYNVLNTAVYMAKKHDNMDIVEVLTSFIKLLQDSIDVDKNELFTTLKQEMNIIEHYLKIQSYRYPDKFKLSSDIDEMLLDAAIPKKIIQPLVENALFHGICASDVDGEINISVLRRDNDLIITVTDNGVGMDENRINELVNRKNNYKGSSGIRHIGITNIRDRIKYLYGEEYGIEIKSTVDEGTVMTITIPFYISERYINK